MDEKPIRPGNESIPVVLNIELVASGSPGISPVDPVNKIYGVDRNLYGVKAKDLYSGDTVYSVITDSRDIGQYLARLLGGKTKDGYVPLTTEVESVGISEEGVKVQVRFTPGIIGVAIVNPEVEVKTLRKKKEYRWWRRVLNTFLKKSD